MIPKVIHYCWFGGAEFSPFIKRCIATWRQKLPDYELKEWNERNFDIDSIPFAQEAYRAKQWAFVADYVRLYALYTEGGIYMDTDVKVLRSFDEFLEYDFFSSHEVHPEFYNEVEQVKLLSDGAPKEVGQFVNYFGLHSAVMASVAGLPYLKSCLDYYNKLGFNLEKHAIEDYIIGGHISRILANYGYRYKDEDQLLSDNMMIFNSSVFVGNTLYLKPSSHAIHLCNGSWREESNTIDYKIRNFHPTLAPVWSIWVKIRRKFLSK